METALQISQNVTPDRAAGKDNFVMADTKLVGIAGTPEKPTLRQTNAYQGAYDYFNHNLFLPTFKKLLPQAYLAIRPHGTSLGHYTHLRWTDGDDGAILHEICICPAVLNGPTENVCPVLVHQMMHLYQHDSGEQGRGKYHNKGFADLMEEIGLVCSANGQPGGSRTGDHMSQYIKKDGLFDTVCRAMPEEFLLPFKPCRKKETTKSEGNKVRKGITPDTSAIAKLTCLGCGAFLMGKPDAQVKCIPCDMPLAVIDQFGNSKQITI